jgi:hypothetical protein
MPREYERRVVGFLDRSLLHPQTKEGGTPNA